MFLSLKFGNILLLVEYLKIVNVLATPQIICCYDTTRYPFQRNKKTEPELILTVTKHQKIWSNQIWYMIPKKLTRLVILTLYPQPIKGW